MLFFDVFPAQGNVEKQVKHFSQIRRMNNVKVEYSSIDHHHSSDENSFAISMIKIDSARM